MGRRYLFLIQHSTFLTNFVPLVHAVPGVDFGHLLAEFFLVALHEAAADDEPTGLTAAGLHLYLLEDGVDTLLFGVADEAAGVDDDGIAVVALPIDLDGMPLRLEGAGEVLAVDSVLRAAEGYDVYLHSNRESTNSAGLKSWRSVIFSPRPM